MNYIEIDTKDFDEFVKILGRHADSQKLLLRLAHKINADTKMMTPVDTGLLRNSWRVDSINNHSVMIYNNQRYAPYIEFGRRKKNGGYTVGRRMLHRALASNSNAIKSMGDAFFRGLLK